MIVVFVELSFFFQAEDGIRDLVRSRGLGDVYKRQYRDALTTTQRRVAIFAPHASTRALALTPVDSASYTAVSYTHLTLPTSDLV